MPKTSGIQYLRRLVNGKKNSKHNKYIVLDMENAEKVIEQFGSSFAMGSFDVRQNSIKAASIALAISPDELTIRLKGKSPNQYMDEISQLKSKISMLEIAGNNMCEHCNNVEAKRKWVWATNLS